MVVARDRPCSASSVGSRSNSSRCFLSRPYAATSSISMSMSGSTIPGSVSRRRAASRPVCRLCITSITRLWSRHACSTSGPTMSSANTRLVEPPEVSAPRRVEDERLSSAVAAQGQEGRHRLRGGALARPCHSRDKPVLAEKLGRERRPVTQSFDGMPLSGCHGAPAPSRKEGSLPGAASGSSSTTLRTTRAAAGSASTSTHAAPRATASLAVAASTSPAVSPGWQAQVEVEDGAAEVRASLFDVSNQRDSVVVDGMSVGGAGPSRARQSGDELLGSECADEDRLTGGHGTHGARAVRRRTARGGHRVRFC